MTKGRLSLPLTVRSMKGIGSGSSFFKLNIVEPHCSIIILILVHYAQINNYISINILLILLIFNVYIFYNNYIYIFLYLYIYILLIFIYF